MSNQDWKSSYLKYKAVIRARLFKYTKKAFIMLPEMKNPLILDIGCGSGVPTLELVKLSGGRVIGLDFNQNLLVDFRNHIREYEFEQRINIIRGTMLQLPFKKNSFDIIWGERSVASIDFETGLAEWRDYIKDNRYLILHDDNINVEIKKRYIDNTGYRLLNSFTLSHDVWWYDYYHPLENIINDFEKKEPDIDDTEMIRDQREILMFKKNPDKFRSIFFIIQKPGPDESAQESADMLDAGTAVKANRG
ncbi:MAG: class I SAM-dependent methyltransferase [Spirochaetes bacterium]|nr:class I SAM-dependent methyltransferase [Spirochaetota bacterium]